MPGVSTSMAVACQILVRLTLCTADGKQHLAMLLQQTQRVKHLM